MWAVSLVGLDGVGGFLVALAIVGATAYVVRRGIVVRVKRDRDDE